MAEEIAIVYMTAGISSRFGGRMKQFAEVGPNGEKLIEYSIKQAIPAGFSKIIFIVGDKTEKPIKDFFRNNYLGTPVIYAIQNYNIKERDRPWGTVEALCSAKNLIDSSIVVCNGDDIYGQSSFKILFRHLQNSNEEATIGYKLIDVLPNNGNTNRGIFKINNEYIKEINEVFNIDKSDLSSTNVKEDDLCSMNLFALHPKTITILDNILTEFKENHKGDRKIECLLPIELSRLIQDGKIKMKIYKTNDKWFGITNPEDEEIVRKELLNINHLK